MTFPFARPLVPACWAAALLIVGGLGRAAPVRATPGVTLNQYRAPAASGDGFTVARPEVGPHLQLEAGLSLDYGHDPLVYEATRGSTSSENVSLVSDQVTAQIGLSLALLERLLVFASLPVNLVLEGDRLGLQPSATGFGAGDLGFGVRGVAVRGPGGGLGLELNLTLPTGADGDGRPAVAGAASATLVPVLIGEVQAGPVRIGANAGLRIQKPVNLPGARFANQITYALALSVPLGSERLRAHAELFGSTLASDAGLRPSSPLEVLLGLKLRQQEHLAWGLAGGFGVLRGYGAPDLRLIGQVAWRTTFAQQAPLEPAWEPEPIDTAVAPEPEPRAAPEVAPAPLVEAVPVAAPDADSDGLADDADGCPALPGAGQASGCPDHISYSPDSGVLTLAPVPRFVRGAARLENSSLSALTSLAAALTANRKAKLMLSVHVDSLSVRDGSGLSRERARAIGLWLQEHGVEATQLEAYGCGSSRPLAVGRGAAAVNERIEWSLVRPLPRLGMPSTLLCDAVSLPLGAATSSVRSWLLAAEGVEAYGGSTLADSGRPSSTRRIDTERWLDRAPRSGVRSGQGCVSK